jgi:3-hydroxyisobutyrate dehydrogenase
MQVAIMGLGEVGRCYATPLHASGVDLVLCAPRPSQAASEMASAWGIPVHSAAGPWLAQVDWVLSCVPGAHALSVAEQAVAHMVHGAGFADLSTASPAVKRAAATTAAAHGVRYVDTAIMGAVSLHGIRTPLLAAGAGVHEFQTLIAQAGGKVQVIEGGAAGDAISLKILRSVFTKGMEALAVEMLVSAEQQGVREQLYAQLRDIDQTPLRSFIDMLVRTHVVHAKRRAHEVHDAQQVLASQGLPSQVLPGVEQRFLATASHLERHPLATPEPDLDQALQWLLATARITSTS